MAELEQALRSLGAQLDYRPTPDLTGAVRRRLAEGRQPRSSWFSRRGVVIALAVLAVSLGAVLAVPPARSTVLDWLGIGNVTVRFVEELPPVDLATSDLGLGEEMPLSEAQRVAPFQVLLPRMERLDDPPRVYYRDEARQVGFLYGSPEKPRLLITQAAAGGAVEKLVNVGGTDTELVAVHPSTPGLWLSGEKHALFFPGVNQEEPFRLVGNALIFETSAGLTVRIEAEVSKDEALEIARSMR